MRTSRPHWIELVVFALVCVLAPCYGQGTFTWITFDGPPVIPPGTSKIVQQYYEAGISFTPIDPNAPFAGFIRSGGGRPSTPENGTAYLQADVAASLKFSAMNGFLLELLAVDLAEYSTLFQQPLAVRFVGYKPDGSTVTTNLVTDGIIDGTGPVADFQTFTFGPEFSGLTRVEIPTVLWSLDNLRLFVPEPGTGALVLVGTAVLAGRFLKRRARL